MYNKTFISVFASTETETNLSEITGELQTGELQTGELETVEVSASETVEAISGGTEEFETKETVTGTAETEAAETGVTEREDMSLPKILLTLGSSSYVLDPRRTGSHETIDLNNDYDDNWSCSSLNYSGESPSSPLGEAVEQTEGLTRGESIVGRYECYESLNLINRSFINDVLNYS